MKTLVGWSLASVVWILVIWINYWMAINGAPQQRWLCVHVWPFCQQITGIKE
jgi:hypothetical protein